MIKPYFRWTLAAIILSLAACINNDIPDPAPVITAGTADFTRYVAIGNSLAAGYTDGGLYNAGQQVAYPNLLAGQFALAKGGSFTSPLFPADQPNGTGYLRWNGYTNAYGATPDFTQVAPQSVRPGTTSLAGTPLYTKYTGDLNNYGIPGIKVADILDATYGNFNGFYERLLPGNAGSNTTSYRDFVFSKPFTFFTVELGSNDVLDYATSDGMTASRNLTNPTLFNANYNNLVGSISSRAGAKNGVLATVPDVTVLQYFHYITLAALKAVAAARGINRPIYVQALFHVGSGGSLDPTTYRSRQANDRDLFMLPLNPNRVGALNYGTIPDYPIESSLVLDADEVSIVQDAITSYNNTIKTLANQLGYPIFDAYTLFNQLKNGVTQDGVTINTNFLTGGVFSLDGIHLTPRGNAYVTDEMIKVINTKYGSNLPALDISKYGGAGSN
jgi:hypothetical protein